MKLKFIFLLLVFAISLISCDKDDETTISEKTYNNIVCHKVIQNSVNSFILIGSSYNNEYGKDLYIAKFDENYDKIWGFKHQKLYNQFGKSVFETDDGFIAVGANANNNSDSLNLFVVKINSSGELQWAKSYFEAYPYSQGNDIVSAYDEGFIISGNIKDFESSSFDNSSTLIMKINVSGDSLNSRIYFGGKENGHSILKFNDNFIISSSIAILVVTNDLNLITLNAMFLEIEAVMTKLYILNNNEYLAYGYTKSNSSFLMKFDHNNDLLWSQEYEDLSILSVAEHKSDFFATGKVKDEYFNKLLIADIDETGSLKFSDSHGTSSDINYDRIGKQVIYLNNNTFAIWENYNLNKLKVYTVNESGEKVNN